MSTSSVTSNRPLEDYPQLFGLFLKRLSCGLDAINDAEIICSFAQHFHVSTRYVMARIKTYVHYETSRMVH